MSGTRQERPPPSYIFHAPSNLNLRQSEELIEFNGHERLLCEQDADDLDSEENMYGEDEILIIRQ